MSLRRLLAISRKEFHHITRDPRTLLLVVVAPAFLLTMLSYVFAFDVDKFSLVVLDQDRTDLSRRYIADLTGDGTFEVVTYLNNYAEVEQWLKSGRVHPEGERAHQYSRSRCPGRHRSHPGTCRTCLRYSREARWLRSAGHLGEWQ